MASDAFLNAISIAGAQCFDNDPMILVCLLIGLLIIGEMPMRVCEEFAKAVDHLDQALRTGSLCNQRMEFGVESRPFLKISSGICAVFLASLSSSSNSLSVIRAAARRPALLSSASRIT